MNRADLEHDYSALRTRVLGPLAARLEEHLRRTFDGFPRIDRIAARAKGIDRFLDKAFKEDHGVRKYSDPLHQIQDQIGARVVAFYLSDVAALAKTVEEHFRPIEVREVVPDSESEFGYFGQHYICLMPTDVYDAEIPEGTGPRFFELQIKTLFQHAWSEAEHDLAYKPLTELTSLQNRKIAFTSAQAWGADRMFDELYQELSKPN